MNPVLNFMWIMKKLAFQTARVRRISEYADLIKPYQLSARGNGRKTLDIGCGKNPRNPFGSDLVYGVDLSADLDNRISAADLVSEPIPFSTAEFDFVTAFDFLEHIPRVAYLPARAFPFVNLMNEIWRVLKPGGLFLSVTPAYPFLSAFDDPTHVNFITINTFPKYFDNRFRYAAIYGFRGSFEVLGQGLKSEHLVSVLRKEIL